MNGGLIHEALERDATIRQYLVGVYSADMLPNMEFPGSYVVSIDNYGHPGQHWVAFFSYDDKLDCFDSFGAHPASYNKHIEKWSEQVYNVLQNQELQSRDTTVCGQYCMFFITLRSYGYRYEDVMSAFSKDHLYNDKLVQKFVNKFFDLRTSLRDRLFMLEQARNGRA